MILLVEKGLDGFEKSVWKLTFSEGFFLLF